MVTFYHDILMWRFNVTFYCGILGPQPSVFILPSIVFMLTPQMIIR